MPIYEFRCNHCDKKLEQLCKLGEPGTQLLCPHCGKRGLNRVVSGFAAPGLGGQDKCGGCSGGNCSTC